MAQNQDIAERTTPGSPAQRQRAGAEAGGVMKRLIAKRKLKRKCDYCNRSFKKGDVYYKERTVIVWDEITGVDVYICPRCKYEEERREKRFARFKESCKHPEEFREMQYSYIPGEAVKEPSHEGCRLCGQVVPPF
ncbi:MAG: hypothetical protein FH756_06095 [Firmicutes bacterium]|nr:hypothetical protein [Bacillota bacterium]